VLDAIESRDPQKAYLAMKGHLEVAKKQTEQINDDIVAKDQSQEVA
jgi:DNA-binding GntR family transcriptional regulator